MGTITQIGAVTAVNFRSLRQRLRPSMVVVVGVAGVVAVLVSMLAMATGLARFTNNGARSDRAVVLSIAATTELASLLNQDMVAAIVNAAGVSHDSKGDALASPEVLISVTLRKKSGSAVDVPLRGIGPIGFAVHPEVKLVSGRAFTPGLHEVIVGKVASGQVGLAVGDSINMRGVDWAVVGLFESNGGVHESELIADADTINSVTHRSGAQSVTALLSSPESFRVFKDSVALGAASSSEVQTESSFYAQSTNQIRSVLTFVAYVIAGIMALGATFGSLTTVSSMISTRAVEIATLRAIGFGPTAVVVSVLVEAMVLAVAGGLLGGALAWMGFNDFTVSTRNGGQHLAFDMAVTPQLLMVGTWWAITIGLISGLFPAIRAARLPVATVLRSG